MKYISGTICMTLSLVSVQANACGNHMFGSGNMSFGEAIMSYRSKAPKRTFNLTHPLITKVTLGEQSEVAIDYERPWLSKDVTVTLSGTENVDLIDSEIELAEYSGTLHARFVLKEDNFDAITVVVSGEHNGETVSQSSKIYVRTKRPSKKGTGEGVQVSSR